MQDKATPSFTIFDDYRPMVSVAVVVRWLLLAAWMTIINYRNEQDTTWLVFNVMGAGLIIVNAYMSWRILSQKAITWQQALGMSLLDLTVITAALYAEDGFQSRYYVFYYPALLGFSLMFPRRASFGALGVVVALYVAVSFTVSPTLDLDEKDEKVLIIRIMTMVGLVTAGALITRWERSRRREAVTAERQTAKENLELQRKAQQAELAAVEERGRIAREIQDGIAQSIYMLSLHLETSAELARQKREDLKERLDGLVNLSKETLLEVRHYIFDLKPYLAGDKGLVSMVENQVREFNTVSGVPTTLETRGEERKIPVPVATCLYRVTQEALSNAFKHARASEVKVLLEFVPDGVQFTVRDDGGGFDGTGSASGHGLPNMRQRAEELGGSFALDAKEGEGTEVMIKLPC